MQIVFYTYLFILGLLFGSFASVVIDRIKNKKSGIISGRSECPKCKHKLGPIDLIPIFSFLFTSGKCRYCKSKISFIYPILEISTGILFLLTGYFLIDINLIFLLDFNEIYKLLFFLLFAFLTIIYVFYDILYLEIPDIILSILISITFITISLQSLFPSFNAINILPSFNSGISHNNLFLLIGFGIFMISSFYFIMLKGLKEIYDILIISVIILGLVFIKYFLQINLEETAIGSAILGSFGIFLFLFLQILLSGGKWMGGGDLRIAILMGFIVGLNFSIQAIMISYILGSIIGIIIILYEKTKNYYITKKSILSKIKKILGIKEKKIELNTKMPFGPFLAFGIYLVLFCSSEIVYLYENFFIL